MHMPPPMPMAINPALQQLLDSLPHIEVPFELVNAPIPNTQPPQMNLTVLCPQHKLSVCEACGCDFGGLNYMHQFLRTAPPEAIPPPPNVPPPPQRAEMVKNAKEQGNVSAEWYLFTLWAPADL
jgi:translocation protein SEC72